MTEVEGFGWNLYKKERRNVRVLSLIRNSSRINSLIEVALTTCCSNREQIDVGASKGKLG